MKIYNRPVLIAGETRTLGTPDVRVLLYDRNSDAALVSGNTVPTDTDAGYAIGCLFNLESGNAVGATLYINEGSASSADFNAVSSAAGGGGAGGSLNAAYENGRTIVIDSGAIVLNDSTSGGVNVLNINKTGAGTGTLINLDMDAGIATQGIRIDGGNAARTAADIRVLDDSSGTHNVIQIDSSGSGATTGFLFTDSLNGNPANFGARFVFDANDGRDSTAIQIVRNAGVRTTPAIDINEGSTGSANVIDVAVSGVYTGNIFDVSYSAAGTGNSIFVNLDGAVAATALHIEGSGVRTQPFVELESNATGSSNFVQIAISGNTSGNVFDISMDAASTGDVFDVDMNASLGGRFLFLDAGGGTRTANLITVTLDTAGATDFTEINWTGTGSGDVFDINVSSTSSGDVFSVVYSGAATGDAIVLDMTAGLAAGAFVITGAGTRTQDLFQIEDSSAGSTHVFDINIASTSSGDVFSVVVGSTAFTGDVLAINLGATATAASAVILTRGAMASTVPLVQVNDAGTNSNGIMFDLNRTGVAAAILFDINDTAATTGNVFDYASSTTSTGTVFEVTLANAVGAILENYTLSGTRTAAGMVVTHSGAGSADIYEIVDSGTSSGHVWDINSTGNSTGDIWNIVFSSSKVAGDVLNIDLGTGLASSALVIAAANIRTEPIIVINNAATDASTDDHVIDINQTGLLDSNVLDITYSSGVSTGNAISLAMGSNVAGMAIDVSSAGTGVSGEGSVLNVAHTGALVAGADVVALRATGSISASSAVLSVEQSSGGGATGALAVYINATGANVEALRVDAGTVTFDETLTVTGAQTFVGTTTYATLNDGSTSLAATALELTNNCDSSARMIAGGATITATQAAHDGKVIALDSTAGTEVTLPAATGTGMILRFLVTVIATSSSHLISCVGSDNFDGMIYSLSDGSDNVIGFIAAVADDTITLNRSTTGSVTNGEYIEIIDSASGIWNVHGFTASTGSEASPFSTS